MTKERVIKGNYSFDLIENIDKSLIKMDYYKNNEKGYVYVWK
jgi:hypothetical protein